MYRRILRLNSSAARFGDDNGADDSRRVPISASLQLSLGVATATPITAAFQQSISTFEGEP